MPVPANDNPTPYRPPLRRRRVHTTRAIPPVCASRRRTVRRWVEKSHCCRIVNRGLVAHARLSIQSAAVGPRPRTVARPFALGFAPSERRAA